MDKAPFVQPAPELGWPHGYIFFWCVAATIVTGLYIWMKRKGWF